MSGFAFKNSGRNVKIYVLRKQIPRTNTYVHRQKEAAETVFLLAILVPEMEGKKTDFQTCQVQYIPFVYRRNNARELSTCEGL